MASIEDLKYGLRVYSNNIKSLFCISQFDEDVKQQFESATFAASDAA
jgi:hypothetical protein